MIIEKITSFSITDLNKLGKYGYTANEKYVVERYFINNELIIRFRKEALKEPYDKTWPILQTHLDYYNTVLEQGNCYAAYLENELLGVIILDIRKWNKTLFIDLIQVSDKHHNEGIGTELLAKAKEIAIENKLRIVALETQNTNVNAIEFYKKNGFTIDGFDLSYYDNNYPYNEVAIFMKCKL
ncbi:GNAT family N-acetyltransferase [Clostridium sp. 'deep sea']|uniref:GNAT family N-acetyltransferase n=1 Tax=Clostridium sp. 'deep sea' TaxID=2779445 RepID=UPI001896706C|nr:GNAT family N-acetyltransferase [Clostridium sp. 'deep sea']QOR36717.1 GNAT family N-acetyltransferase [Clostridium sp. 'deep sea']